MILALDCGNTMIKVGVYEGKTLKSHFKIRSDRNKSYEEYAIMFKNYISEKIDGAIISSVVPILTDICVLIIKNLYDVEPLIVGKGIKTKMSIKIDNPSELGSDMLCGAIGAFSKYNEPLLVADLGTATKIYVVDKNKSFIGGIITAGMESSLKGLVGSTSLLHEVSFNLPSKIICKNTKDCIQSGIINSQIFAIKEFAKEMEKELGYSLKKVISGGFSEVIKEKLPEFDYIEHVVLDGLVEVYYANK